MSGKGKLNEIRSTQETANLCEGSLVDCTVVTRLALNRVHNSAKAQQLLLTTVQQTPGITFPVLLDMTRPSPNRNTVLQDTTWNVSCNFNTHTFV